MTKQQKEIEEKLTELLAKSIYDNTKLSKPTCERLARLVSSVVVKNYAIAKL